MGQLRAEVGSARPSRPYLEKAPSEKVAHTPTPNSLEFTVCTIDGQALNGGDRGADCSFHRNGARTNGSAVHVHRARPALADPATVLRTREIDRIANSPEKRCVRFRIDDVPKPVNGKRESHERPSSEIRLRALNLTSCLPRPRASQR